MAPSPDQSDIPQYLLFGESGAVSDAEFVHLEDIPSRSALYRWAIPPHTHRGLFQMVIVTQGKAKALYDDYNADMGPGSVILIPPGCVHTFQFLPGSDGYVLTTTEAMLYERAPGQERPMLGDLLTAPRIVDLSKAPAVRERVLSLVRNIEAEFREPGAGRTLMLDWLGHGVLLLLHRESVRQGAPKGAAGVRLALFNRFRALSESHFRDHWAIPQYAAALNTSESRLNRICRELTGRSAFDIVNDRLLLEAKRKLIYIAAPVSVLAYELGFQDPAYFSRYFRRHTGLSPLEYRQQARVADPDDDLNGDMSKNNITVAFPPV